MSWRDNLLSASFNNASFVVEAHDHTGGQRHALHEYPLRDIPYAEPLGRRADEFSVDAFVLASALGTDRRGDNYIAARDALLNELRKASAGTLVHPYLGIKQVVPTEYRLRESTERGGMAVFTITFIEAGQQEFPTSVADTARGVADACDAAAAAIQDDFAFGFHVTEVPAYVADSATQKLGDFVSSIRGQSAKFQAIGDDVTSFSAQLDALGAAAADLVRQPKNLASDVVGVFVAARGIVSNVRGAFDAYRNLFDFGAADEHVPQTTATRQLQESNRFALNALIQRAALLEAARAASDIEYTSFGDAIDTRDALASKIDDLLETASDDVFAPLAAVRAAVVRDVTARGADLARIVQFTPRTTLPALVLAHQLYGDATRADDIVARNRVRHPGFVTGGRAIEVLSDA